MTGLGAAAMLTLLTKTIDGSAKSACNLAGLTCCRCATLLPCCAGALVLESLEHAQARGAPILAEFIGGYFTCDAHHISEPLPSGKGVSMCIERWALHPCPPARD